MVPGLLSRRDSAKVAHYEVLRNEAKRDVVPQGTKETLGFWFRTRLSDCQHSSIVPSGTDSSLKTLTQHFVLGCFRQVPAGLIFSNHQSTERLQCQLYLFLRNVQHRSPMTPEIPPEIPIRPIPGEPMPPPQPTEPSPGPPRPPEPVPPNTPEPVRHPDPQG